MRDTRMSLASFERLAARGNLVPVWRELPGDTETPVSAFLKLPTPSHAFLLESVQGGERWGRYSFLGDEPIALIRQGPDGTVLEQAGSRTFDDQLPPLDALRELMDAFDFVRPDDAPRSSEGWWATSATGRSAGSSPASRSGTGRTRTSRTASGCSWTAAPSSTT